MHVSFPAEAAHVSYDVASCDTQSLIDSVAKLGYGVRPIRGLDEALPRHEELERRLTRRLAVAWVLGMWTMTLALVDYISTDLADSTRYGLSIAQGVSALPIILYCGRDFFVAGWRTLRARTPGLDTLISIAVASACAVSVWNLLRGVPSVYFDTAVMLIAFQLLARFTERLMRRRASDSLRGLLALTPETAERLDGHGMAQQVDVRALEVGDVIRVASGSACPVDGRVVRGESALDVSIVSGESEPVAVVQGDTVLAGAVNGLGVLEVQVVHSVGTRQVDGWAKTIQAALFAKPSLQHAAERAAQHLSFIAVGGAVLALVLALGSGASAEAAWARTLATLLIACPCALTMAIPLGVSAALGKAAQAGILVRDPAALERAGAAVEVVLDKTGTLTQGKLRRVGVDKLSEMPTKDIVAIARSMEVGQTHPIARALAHADDGESVRVSLTAAVPGSGVQGHLEQPIAQLAPRTLLRLGRADWIAKESGMAIPALNEICLGTAVWLAAVGPDGGSQWLGRLRFADVVRDDARQLVESLRKDGLQVRVLSGDSDAACHALAREVSLSPAQVRARCSPDDKRNDILRAQGAGRTVIFVGDGLNDGMALAQAELGIATVEATESAKVAASAVLMDQRLSGIPALVHISRRARRVVRQSLAASALYNALLIPAAIAGVLTPMMSAVAMTLGTLSVILNTQRLRAASTHAVAAPAAAPSPATRYA